MNKEKCAFFITPNLGRLKTVGTHPFGLWKARMCWMKA